MPTEDLAAFRRYLDSLPEDQRAEIIDALRKDYVGRENTLDEQSALAEELRGTPMPGMYDAGRFKIAANPLEFAGTGYQQYRGGKMAEDIQAARDELSRGRETGTGAVMDYLLRGAQRAPVNTPPIMPPRMGAQNPPVNMAALLRGIPGL